ncbi:MAG TPA: ABC transporter substrate-binding protein, partial [Chitinophagaceae bacterium]|nr:ABC transporter substrate-binding protein [Chitinophagaceae bacterium]
MINYKFSTFLFIYIIFSIPMLSQELRWTETAPGVWKGVMGKPETYDLLKAAGVTPNEDALSKMATIVFPFIKRDVSGRVNDGKTYLQFPLEKEEQLYGFGLNFQSVHQRGKVLQLHMDHYGGRDNGRTHAPVPFYVSSHGYGVFINS